MAALNEGAVRYDSSAGELSSPPSGSLSDPDSPSRRTVAQFSAEIAKNGERGSLPQDVEILDVSNDANQQMVAPEVKRIAISTSTMGEKRRYGWVNGEWVWLTNAGVPRRKPGRKPGTQGTKARPSDGADGPTWVRDSDLSKAADPLQAKIRKPKKPRDPDAPPAQRKRKAGASGDDLIVGTSSGSHQRSLAPAGPVGGGGSYSQAGMAPLNASFASHSSSASATPSAPSGLHPQQYHNMQYSSSQQGRSEHFHTPNSPKRDTAKPGSMQSILNADPPAHSRSPSGPTSSTIPVRSSGQSYDPIRGNYDPVRETMSSHNAYSSNAGSPRAPATQPSYRSPSIASMVDAIGPSPQQSNTGYQPASVQSRFHATEPTPAPSSPSQRPRHQFSAAASSNGAAQQTAKKEAAVPSPPPPRPVIKESNFTTIANGPIRKVSDKQKPGTGVSTPLTEILDDTIPEGEGRSILDFGRARPGEEAQAPTISLNIPITAGETNKYVNFMRLAEDRYGWDALHHRLAANRDRKARIAAAAASLEKVESGRESGDEMSVDLSDAEASNPENGGTSGPDAPAKPKKKRNFKEDQYDVDDDFVDDSEMLWEAQAAASRDGFFVYSGPLVPEPEKPAAGSEDRPKRGRGGRGSRGGGRGASTRGSSGTGRGGGPGSRGGSITRKPRITKSEKLQREREKAERESMARVDKTPTNGYVLQPTTPSFAVSELGA